MIWLTSNTTCPAWVLQALVSSTSHQPISLCPVGKLGTNTHLLYPASFPSVTDIAFQRQDLKCQIGTNFFQSKNQAYGIFLAGDRGKNTHHVRKKTCHSHNTKCWGSLEQQEPVHFLKWEMCMWNNSCSLSVYVRHRTAVRSELTMQYAGGSYQLSYRKCCIPHTDKYSEGRGTILPSI